MKYKYTVFQDNRMPLLHVTLRHGKNRIDLDCPVDSGAGDCIFSKDIAEILGIDIKTGEPRDYEGIGGAGMTGYLHQVKLKPKGFSKWVTVEAGSSTMTIFRCWVSPVFLTAMK